VSEEFLGKWVVLYFYPKTARAADGRGSGVFRAQAEVRKARRRDSGGQPGFGRIPRKFAEKNKIAVTLLSDTEHSVIKAYDAWGTKKMYGKEFEGVLRSTALIDPKAW